MMPPTLTTARLTLRPFQLSDFDAYADVLTGPRAQHMGGPYDRARAWNFFNQEMGLWVTAGLGGLIAQTHDGVGVGAVGFSSQHDPVFPEDELGWMAFDGFEGQGFITEAAAALRDWGFGPGGLTTFVSYIAPENTRSAAVAERLGAVIDAQAPRQDDTDLVYRHQRVS